MFTKHTPSLILTSSIPPIQSASSQSEPYFSQQWLHIQRAVTAFMLSQPTGQHLVKLTRALKNVLAHQDYSLLNQHLMALIQLLFQQLFEAIATSQQGCLGALLAYFTQKQQQYKILFDTLNQYTLGYGGNQTMEENIYGVLCGVIKKSGSAKQCRGELLQLINRYRVAQSNVQLGGVQLALKLAAKLGIFKLFQSEFLAQSRAYFVSMSQLLPPTIQLFSIIQQTFIRQKSLNRILHPSSSTLPYAQKQLLHQFYSSLLLHLPELIRSNSTHQLQLLYTYTLQQDQQKMLESHLVEYVRGVAEFLTKEKIGDVVEWVGRLGQVVQGCFQGSKRMSSVVHNSLQESIMSKEKEYNELVGQGILEAQMPQDTILGLFRLAPNKQHFIRQLQVGMFKWLAQQNPQDFAFQQSTIQILKKQCGYTLCKSIERMLLDVWRDGALHYYHHSHMQCRLLSRKDWPKITIIPITLPQPLNSMRQQFQQQFRTQPQNNKQLVWVSQLGTVDLTIYGVTSIFSQVQAAIIFVLGRSFRPIKALQIAEILQAPQEMITQVVNRLQEANLLTFYDNNNTYQLNQNNSRQYSRDRRVVLGVQQTKVVVKSDDTFVLEAWIVKIMKRKKYVQKTDLTKLLCDNLRFQPTLGTINLVIDKLESRQYLQVDRVKGMIRYRE